MPDIYHFLGKGLENENTQVTIASGPVIIEEGKVLLDKHGDDNLWKFPGGRLSDSISMKDNVIKKAHDELGLEIELLSEPFVIAFKRENEYVILIHYLASRTNSEITPGDYIKEWAWHDIKNLPEGLAQNIIPVIKNFS